VAMGLYWQWKHLADIKLYCKNLMLKKASNLVLTRPTPVARLSDMLCEV